MSAAIAGDTLTLTWEGNRQQEVRLLLSLVRGVPTIREVAVRTRGGAWATVASGLTPEFRIASGIRRMSNQQIQPLDELKVPITPEILEKERWDAFWDAPLYIGGTARQGGNPPPAVASPPARSPAQGGRSAPRHDCVPRPGLRGEIEWRASRGVVSRVSNSACSRARCSSRSTAARISFARKSWRQRRRHRLPTSPDAGLTGVAVQPDTRLAWRDASGTWQENHLGGSVDDGPVVLKTANRTVIAETRAGSIAVFPPPHTFFWAREIETNLGYNWYRKDSPQSFSLGIRQAEREESEQYQENFALYSAPPGTVQRMPVYWYVSADRARRGGR